MDQSLTREADKATTEIKAMILRELRKGRPQWEVTGELVQNGWTKAVAAKLVAEVDEANPLHVGVRPRFITILCILGAILVLHSAISMVVSPEVQQEVASGGYWILICLVSYAVIFWIGIVGLWFMRRWGMIITFAVCVGEAVLWAWLYRSSNPILTLIVLGIGAGLLCYDRRMQ